MKGVVSPRLEVPPSIPRPPYVGKRDPPFGNDYQIQDAEVTAPTPEPGPST